MAQTIAEIENNLITSLVAYSASIDITINPAIWSKTDYKQLLLHCVAAGEGYQQQLFDLFQSYQETLISQAQPQTGLWFQAQMLLFQFNSTTPQVPIIQPSSAINPLSVVWNPVAQSYRVISFCSVVFGSAGRCLIKIAAISGGVPVNTESLYPGCLAAATSFVNLCAAPGISYVVSSGNSDWLFLQLDVYYIGVYSSVIFSSVQSAITLFLNSIPFNGVMKLSLLEEAILAVAGVNDMEFINVAARPDIAFVGSTSTTWGTASQEYLVSSSTEEQRSWSTSAGYISLENGTSTGGAIANSQLNQYRVGSSGALNLNLIAV